MSNAIEAYVKGLEEELARKEGELASMKRAVERIQEKLKRPEYYYSREEKRGTKRVKVIKGEATKSERKTAFKRNTAVKDESVPPSKSDNVPAPAAPAEKEEKKSSWSLF